MPNIHFRSYVAQICLEWNMLPTNIIERIKTHILCSIILFSENRAVYEEMWKNRVQLDRPQMTQWRMRIACWIPKATNTHSEYEILIAVILQQWLHERDTMLRHTYTACLVSFTIGKWAKTNKTLRTSNSVLKKLSLLKRLPLVENRKIQDYIHIRRHVKFGPRLHPTRPHVNT
jgi:hypothetical protein